MEEERTQQTETIEWRGITIEVTFEPDWLNMAYTAHLQLRSVFPERAKLPVTETGYLSHFTSLGAVYRVHTSLLLKDVWFDSFAPWLIRGVAG
jgi:hypothetical protein